MSFPRYESYKDSGIEWLGEVPVHWTPSPQPLSHQGRGANKHQSHVKNLASAEAPNSPLPLRESLQV